MFWYVYTYNSFFIYNIIYVIKHILCYVIFITKMFEIKQNELNAHVCIIYPGPDINSPILSQTSQFLSQKITLHFFTMCNFQKPFITRGYFTFPKNPPWLPEGECVPLPPTTQISPSRSPPKFPPKTPNFHSRTTSTHLRKVLYFQQLSAP